MRFRLVIIIIIIIIIIVIAFVVILYIIEQLCVCVYTVHVCATRIGS